MINLGDFPVGHTAVCIPFDSFAAATGASSAASNFAASDVLIYKDFGTTQRSSSAGITVSTSFDSQTGLQGIVIDLSDNTDVGFYAAGHEYQVAVADITIDSQTVRFWAGTFSIERAGGVLALLKGNAVKVDVNTIKTQSVTAGGAVTVGAFVGNATAALSVDASGRVDVIKVAGTIQTAGDIIADTNDIQSRLPAALTGAGNIKADALVVSDKTGYALTAAYDAAKTAATQTSVDDLPTNAELATALAGADDAVLAAVAALDGKVDTIDTNVDSVLADTNELQTDWVDGGRLDLILDARASQTSVDDLPTTAELAAALASADDAVLAAVATVDTVVDAIKVTTDKLDDTLEDDAGTFRFTTNALEQAPTGGSAPTAADIADAVWDEATAGHQTAGTTGKALTDAQSAGDPWATELETGYTASRMLRSIAGAQAGKSSITELGGGAATVVFRNISDTADQIEADMEGSERTAVTVAP